MIERAPKLFLRILQNRFKLLSLELQEEVVRLKRQIVLAALGSTLGFAGFAGLGLLIVYLVPTVARAVAASAIVAVFIIAAVILLITARVLARHHTPFEATIATLDKDLYDT